MNLNFKQVLAIAGVVLGVAMVSTSQLTDIFGSGPTKIIVSASAMLSMMLNGVLAVISGQAAMVRDVAAMPGIEPLKVNAQANPTLAAIAIDPDQPKVGGMTPQVQAQLKEIAKG